MLIDLHSPEFYKDPFPTFEYLRHNRPVYFDDVDQRWMITRYHDISSVLRNHETFSAEPYSRFTDVIGITMAHMDGKDHDSRRSIVAPEMVGSRLENAIMPHVRAVSRSLIDGLPRKVSVEIRSSLTKLLPLRTMTRMLGMMDFQESMLADVTTKVIRALQGDEPHKSIGIEAHKNLEKILMELIAERRAGDGKDLITGILHARDESGNSLSEVEICSFVTLLLAAGSETTELGLMNFLQVLLEHPDIIKRLRSDPTLINAAFTEFMRRDGVVAYEDRTVAHETELHGIRLKKGEIVRVALLSGNNDEEVFKNPRSFVVERSDLILDREHRSGGVIDGRANQLGFGLGKHFCIGYLLARAEIVTAITQLLESSQSIDFASKEHQSLQLHWWNWGVERLAVYIR